MKCLSLFIIGISIIALNYTLAARTFIVTKTTDTYPIGAEGELRWAIQQSNKTKSSKPHKIHFNIEGSGPFVIEPISDLDPITQAVDINGYSQSGSTVNTLSKGSNATLLIVLSGKRYKTGDSYLNTGNGLTIQGKQASQSTIRGLVINNWINSGILISDTNDIGIFGNFIGTNQEGTQEQANQAGVFVKSSNTVLIGNEDKKLRNIIAGSFFYFNGSACVAAYDTREIGIINNCIGLNRTGEEVLGNSLVGIECVDCDLAVTGLNIISGHSVMNVSMINVGAAYIIQNLIGTDAGSSKFFEGNIGISVVGSGTMLTEMDSEIQTGIYGNLIAGHKTGIKLGSQYYPSTRINGVVENIIGANATGVVLQDDNNILATNILGDNDGNVLIYGSSVGNTITGNQIMGGNFGVQVGLAGNLGRLSNNIFEDNQLSEGATISALCRPSVI